MSVDMQMLREAQQSTRAGSGWGVFPGPRLTGLAMVGAPLLMLGGSMVLSGVYDAGGTDIVGNFAAHRGQALLGLNLATAGTVLASLALAGLASLIAAVRPGLGRAGGALGVLGLFGPGFFLGIYFTAAQLGGLTPRADVGHAIDTTQSTPHVINLAGPLLVAGFVVLAIGAYRARVLGRAQSIALAVAAIAPVGFISGVLLISVAAWAGFAVALVPLGVRLLRGEAT